MSAGVLFCHRHFTRGLVTMLLAISVANGRLNAAHLVARRLPAQSQVELTVAAGTPGGYIEHSEDLVSWQPWAAFTSCSTDLVHIATTGSGKGGFFRLAQATVPAPDTFVFIPPGRFLMGSPDHELERGYDENQHSAIVHRGFWMCRTEVTIRQWLELMSRFHASLYENRDPESAANYVSWRDAMDFCRLMTLRDTAAGRIPAGSSYRLPTETEWEYAARAGTTTRFSFGDDPEYVSLARCGWYATNSSGRIHPVGELSANPWGLHDVHGNVFEWCLDPDTPYPGSTRILYHSRMYRGGSYYCPGRVLRSADRSHVGNENTRDSLNGLRLVIGYAPDSLRTVEVMPQPASVLDWRPDHSTVSLGLTTVASGAAIQYRMLLPNRSELFTNYTGPILVTNAATFEARVIKPATVVSDGLLITLDRAEPPQFKVVDDNLVVLTSAAPEATIEFRELPDGEWLSYKPNQLLARSSTWLARCWNSDTLSSSVVNSSIELSPR